MENLGFIALASAVILYAFFSRRLAKTPLTGPMLFMGLGMVMGPPALDWLDPEVGVRVISLLLELTLTVVLFTEAFKINLRELKDEVGLPTRMLGIGFPLMVLVGWAIAYWLFPDLGVAGAAVVGVLLAPTDGALGQAVISNPRVPHRVRNALNVESGLNDGLALPFFFVALDWAVESEAAGSAGAVLASVLQQVLVASAVGVIIGFTVARLGIISSRREWSEAAWLEIALVATALTAWAIADGLGASGFIAAWVAGLSCGLTAKRHMKHTIEFSEDLGYLLTLVSFAVFGSVALGAEFDLGGMAVIYALLTLFVIRMVSVLAATAGTGLGLPTRAYLGWFGPRGLASIILVLIVIEKTDLASTPAIASIMVVTVGLSVVLHGATSWWGSNRYADWVESRRADDRAI